MVIHDLRGPATSIQLGSELALKEIRSLVGRKNSLIIHDKKSGEIRNQMKLSVLKTSLNKSE